LWVWAALQCRVIDLWLQRRLVTVAAQPVGLAGTLFDISARKQLEATLRAREAGLSSLMGSLHDLVLALDGEGKVLSCHLPAEFELDLPDGPWLGRPVEALLPEGLLQSLHVARAGLAQDGRRRSVECSWPAPLQGEPAQSVPAQGWRHGLASLSLLQAALDGGAPGALLVLRDITEHKVKDEAVRQLAYFDPLTALPNRRLLHDRLQQVQASSQRRGRHGALMFIDLDHFKEVNDRWGHRCGDQLLVELARRLQVSVRACDTVARLGGDEFIVVLADLDPHEQVARSQLGQIAGKMLARLARSYELDGRRHQCTASLGAVLFMGKEPGMDHLIAQADAAMYRAKASGRNALSIGDGVGGVAAAPGGPSGPGEEAASAP
jgi:diguanylate cyclase (GGDEF)-like protein